MRFNCIPLAVMALAAGLLMPPQRAAAADAPKPNIILILIDDLGYADIGPFGSKLNRTPNLERMAAEGMKLTSFYAAPVCSPSRASIMTGCYPKRVGIPRVLFPADPIGINPSERTLPELLKAQGYSTMCVGKWHLGDQPEFLPTKHGFDHYYGIPYSNDMGTDTDGSRAHIQANAKKKNPNAKGHPPLPLMRDDKVLQAVQIPDQEMLVTKYTEEAVKFLRASKDKPFFLYLAHNSVHLPYYPGPNFKGKSGHGPINDWVEETDWSVGEVFKALKELKLDEKTLVIFTSDNGGTRNSVNAPLKGFKASTQEGGMREPTIARWPGKIAPGTKADATTSTMDLLPTFVKLAGGMVPTDRKIDGHDLWPLLSGKTTQTAYDAFYYIRASAQTGGELDAVRSGPWKLEVNTGVLYNLDTDIGETTNVAANNAAEVKKLQAFAERFKADLGATGEKGPGVRAPGRIESPLPLINHDGTIRTGFAAPGKN